MTDKQWFEDIEAEPKDKSVTKSMIGKSKFYKNCKVVTIFPIHFNFESLVEEVRKLNWFQRTFRSIGEGSVRGSVFTLFSGSVGAGVLSLPQVMSYYGLTTGVCMILLNSVLAYTSYTSLFKAIIKSGKKRYPNLVNYYLGKTPAKLFAICIICV